MGEAAENLDYEMYSERLTSKEVFRKPAVAYVLLRHANGTMAESEKLEGDKVPDPEEWEDKADRLWIKHSHSRWRGTVVRIQIRRDHENGPRYLKDLFYSE